MRVDTFAIPGLLRITPKLFRDERGAFCETWHEERYRRAGINGDFSQDNRSVSAARVLRGLHYQVEAPQGHLVTVTRGRIHDVALDLRPASPTFGKWQAMTLSADPPVQAYLPPGVAHGFCVLGDEGADIWYRCVGYYRPGDEAGVVWNDPDLAIDWPLAEPVVAERDAAFPRLKDVPRHRLPQVEVTP